jgi:hypothetical protein
VQNGVMKEATTSQPLELSRAQVLGHRRRAGGLDERVPMSRASLERAAWAGLTDSMPRAAVLSIHARVAGSEPSTWEDPALVQVWGPRFSAYVVAARDRAVFTLGRLPDPGPGRRRAEETAAQLRAFLGDRRMRFGEAGRGLGVRPNMLRYGTATGTIVMRWDGARQPTIWMVDPPAMDPFEARLELARRYLHIFGPGTPGAFALWAGVKPPRAQAAFEALESELTPVRTPIGDGWILAADEASYRAASSQPAAARLLPSGDSYYLLQGSDRALLVPDPQDRARLWTTRVWPGAVLVDGEIVGTWRRANAEVTASPWRPLSAGEREAVEAEAAALPLPGLTRAVAVRWED